ncbi:uncharacterized protein LOC134718240 [Mytilus trossulus]|uniref:uncharacterized protein LOC134718240 n=1 Tax=Mytilus trossulus TaxID=6551 RepID=UPI003003AC8D
MVVQVLVVAFLLSFASTAPIDLSCNVPVDLVFVLDGSDSLKESEFSASKQFVLDVIQSLTLGKQNVQLFIELNLTKCNHRWCSLPADLFCRYELEQIASDSQKTLILTNSMTDPAFLQEFEDKLRPRVCEVSITTEKATTTVIPMLPSTEKLVPDKYCPNCMKDVNYGYKPYPGDCTKYYDVRPDENGGAIQDVKKCPFGTFWDSTYLTCQYTWMVNCVYDPCRSYSSGTLAMPGVCSGYWTCSNFRGNATCCSRPNQRYVQGVGCLEDFSCTTPCPDDDSNRIQVPQQCYRYPYQPDQSKYYEENHGFNITRSCAPGTWFDQNTCSCSITSGLNSGNIQAPIHFPDELTRKTTKGEGEYMKQEETYDMFLTFGNQRDKSIEIWNSLNNELIEQRAVLLNGKEFFNVWQANRRPLLKSAFVDELNGDSFNLWSPKMLSRNRNGRRLRIMPRNPNKERMWQRSLVGCGPDVSYEFNSSSGITDSSSNGVLAGFLNIVLNGHTAAFNGQSMLNIWRFSNVELKNRLVIEFQFKTSGSGIQSEALVSNCIGSDLEEASLLIVANRGSNTVLFRTVTDKGTSEISAPYIPGAMNSVTYIYDGQRMICAVNSMVVQSFLTGDIQTRQTGIIIGAASKWASFQGDMDNFHLYRCIPASVVPLLSK